MVGFTLPVAVGLLVAGTACVLYPRLLSSLLPLSMPLTWYFFRGDLETGEFSYGLVQGFGVVLLIVGAVGLLFAAGVVPPR